ncbi:MAG: hypothetical protein ACFFD4_10365 [Candidatus Odinarchaeota archaeon]
MKRVLIGCLLFAFLFFSSIGPISAVSVSENLSLYPISHQIKVGSITESHWTEETVSVVDLGPNAIPDSDYENRTLEGAKLYIAYDSSFLYMLIDSIYVKQQMRLDYGLVAFDATNDNVSTHLTDQYYFTAFGANYVYFSQHVQYNTTIDPETGEEEGFSISHCLNMPPDGLHRDLQLWGFYRASWNEATLHELFSFKIPLTDFGEFTIPYTFGLYAEVYKSTTNDEDANPDTGPLASYPLTGNMSDQSTWAKVTLNQSSGGTTSSTSGTTTTQATTSGYEFPAFLISTGVLAIITSRKKRK